MPVGMDQRFLTPTLSSLQLGWVAWPGWLAEPMGLFRASNQAQAPSGAAANLRTAACTDVAINYPRSHWGPAPEGRRQRLQPRTGARNRQLILVSSLTGRWACWACGAGWLLLQRGSLLPLYPSFPSVLLSAQLRLSLPLPFPSSSGYPCFLLPLHPFLPPAPPARLSKAAPWHCFHPQSRAEAGPCLPHSAPSRCPRARARATGTWASCATVSGTNLLAFHGVRQNHDKQQGHPQGPDPPCCSPALGDMRLAGHGQSAAQPGQPSNAEKGRVIPSVTSLKRANAASHTADGKSYSREGKRGAH